MDKICDNDVVLPPLYGTILCKSINIINEVECPRVAVGYNISVCMESLYHVVCLRKTKTVCLSMNKNKNKISCVRRKKKHFLMQIVLILFHSIDIHLKMDHLNGSPNIDYFFI